MSGLAIFFSVARHLALASTDEPLFISSFFVSGSAENLDRAGVQSSSEKLSLVGHLLNFVAGCWPFCANNRGRTAAWLEVQKKGWVNIYTVELCLVMLDTVKDTS